jgi:coniferyl-aldehyde dehydrogenase
LQATLEDARAKGATLINLAEGQIPYAKRRKFPPHLVLDSTEDMQVMQREIFGPIRPIRTKQARSRSARAEPSPWSAHTE